MSLASKHNFNSKELGEKGTSVSNNWGFLLYGARAKNDRVMTYTTEKKRKGERMESMRIDYQNSTQEEHSRGKYPHVKKGTLKPIYGWRPRQMRRWPKRLTCGTTKRMSWGTVTCDRRFMTTMSLIAHWNATHKNGVKSIA